MTLHVFSRPASRLVVLAAILLLASVLATAQSAALPQTTPALAERLERLAAEFDRNRIDLHVPGAVLASQQAPIVGLVTGPGEAYGAPGHGSSLAVSLLTVLLLFLLWWLATRRGWFKPLFLPAPRRPAHSRSPPRHSLQRHGRRRFRRATVDPSFMNRSIP